MFHSVSFTVFSATFPPDSCMTQYFRSSTPFLIPCPTDVNPAPPSSSVAQNMFLAAPCSVLPDKLYCDPHTFDFMNGHIFITYLNYNTKKQTTSFRSRDDDRCRPGATPQFILPTDSVDDVKKYRHSIHKILLHKSKRVDRVHATGTLTRSNVCVKSNKSVIVTWFFSLI